MDWHRRYSQQAAWTRDLRGYLFAKAGLANASRVLEVGCGTGAILSELPEHIPHDGLDIDRAALAQCRLHDPAAALVRGDALALPYCDQTFDIVYCHFLLLWVGDPLQALLEMKRVTRMGSHVLAFAEPDYSARIDEPRELLPLGEWQTASLRRQGANPDVGAQLADLFFEAGLGPIETETIEGRDTNLSPGDWELEWAVIESDLVHMIPAEELREMKHLDQRARKEGRRVLHVPTYFAWGRA